MDKPPIWLLDIDGVLNANRPGWGAAPRKATVAGYVMRWAPPLLDRIRSIHNTVRADVHWSSTWCGTPLDLETLARMWCLDLPRAFTTRPDHQTWAEVKAEAAMRALAAGRRLIWTDDTEAGSAPRLYPPIAEAGQAGRALLIAPRPNRGLQPAHLDTIEAFIG